MIRFQQETFKSKKNSRDFGRSRDQGLANPVYRLRIIWYFSWWP